MMGNNILSEVSRIKNLMLLSEDNNQLELPFDDENEIKNVLTSDSLKNSENFNVRKLKNYSPKIFSSLISLKLPSVKSKELKCNLPIRTLCKSRTFEPTAVNIL